MGRLTGETLDGETACYSYDHAGNRLTRTGAGRTEYYRYNSRNQLTELDSTAGTVRYEYDPAGSLTAEVHTAQGGSSAERTGYIYDAYNRNISVCGAGYVQQNHYDAEGLRYAVTENGKTTNFVYRNGMPVSELDADKNPVRGYVLGNEYISQVDGTTFSYYLNDEQGSVRYLTGSDGSIRNHYRYSAFGETITAEETVPNRLRYNGQMADGLTGLYYLRARYYNASLGRFTQEDVIYNDGLNLYAYCNSNPVMYSDPSGFAAKSTPKGCNPKNGGEKDSKSGTSSINLPEYDGKTTHGVLVLDDGTQVPFSSGNANPNYKNYIPASHVEGKSAIYMRENGINNGTVFHNNTDGTCPYCDKMLPTLLEEGSTLMVVPPANASAPKPSWVDTVKTYIGNDKIPKKPK